MTWLDFFAGYFSNVSRTKRLMSILDLGGCREGWLQGELCLWLQDEYRQSPVATLLSPPVDWGTNCRLALSREATDLVVWRNYQPAQGAPFGILDVVGEVKILGGHYQRKVFSGNQRSLASLWTRLSARPGCLVRPVDVRGIRSFSLLNDYRRLLTLPAGMERLLVLVVDNRSDGAQTMLGTALSRVHFAPPVQYREVKMAKDVTARLWNVS